MKKITDEHRLERLDVVLLFLIVIGGFLIFSNLGNMFLWQDEAESALFARNVIKFGYPRAYDGRNFVNPYAYTGFGKNYQWKYQPWLQFYLIAFFYAILGESTFASRLPFAIFGFLSIVLIFFLTKRLFKKNNIALLTTLFTSTSIPFLLHVRQCRYYSLQIFLMLVIALMYFNVTENKGKYLWLLGILLVLLCHTNHGVFVPVFGTVIIHFFFIERNSTFKKKFIFMCFAVLFFTIPWFIYSYTPAHLITLKFAMLKKNFGFQLRVLNKYVFPIFLFMALYLLHCLKNKTWRIQVEKDEKNALVFILLLVLINLCFYSAVEQRMFRYYVHLFAFLYMLQAYLLLAFFKKKKISVTILVLLLIFTDILHNSLPYIIKAAVNFNDKAERTALLEKADFYFFEYLYEVTHDYDGPVEGTVKFLKEHAKPGDTVKVAYDDHSLMFYLPYLKIENRHFFDSKDFPEWIVWRDYWINEYRYTTEDYRYKGYALYDEEYIEAIKKRYKAHQIPYPDIIWENRPDDLEYHKFKTERGARNVIIYERKEL